MAMRIRRKLRDRSGFSLAETLLATLILLMVTLLLANGVPTAKSLYERVTVSANARVLLSTAISALRNELGTAKGIRVNKADKWLSYYSTDISARSRIYLYDDTEGADKEKGAADRAGTPKDTVMLQEYIITDDVALELEEGAAMGLGTPRRLATSVTDTKNDELYVTYGAIDYSGNMLKFEDLKVLRGKEDPVCFASLDELYILVTIGPIEDMTTT